MNHRNNSIVYTNASLHDLPFNEISSSNLNDDLATFDFFKECDSLRMFETLQAFAVYADNFITCQI